MKPISARLRWLCMTAVSEDGQNTLPVPPEEYERHRLWYYIESSYRVNIGLSFLRWTDTEYKFYKAVSPMQIYMFKRERHKGSWTVKSAILEGL